MSDIYTFLPPQAICQVGGFLGQRFHANDTGRIQDALLSEEFIRRHERKDHFEWFWLGEQIGKWFDAAAYTATLTKDQGLLNRIHMLLDRLEKTQEEDGAVSITLRRNRVPARGMELYEYYYVLHGLLVLHELLGSEKALAMATRLGEYIIHTWGVEPGQFPLAGRFPGNGHGGGEGTLILEPIILLGMRTGQKRFIDWGLSTLAKWDAWLDAYPESRFTCGFTAMRQFAAGEKEVYDLRKGIHAHTFHMTLLGIAALYNATGDNQYRDIFLGCTNRLADEWIFLTGGMSTGEGYLPRRYYHPRGDIEVCPQHTWILMLAQAYRWTGEPQYLSEIERDLFNHFLAAQLADGTNWSYMTPLAGRAQEPETPNCCNAAGMRIAARMPTYLYGQRGGEPSILLYTSSQAVFDLPDIPPITVTQQTGFPTDGEVTLRVDLAQPAGFPLHLRIPPYADGAWLQVNNEPPFLTLAGQFAKIERLWQPGDMVHLHLPLPMNCVANEHVTAVTRGPLVYACFQTAQPDNGIYLGRRGQYPEDLTLQLDPGNPKASITEQPPAPGLLGPALRVSGVLQPKPPMFASAEGNRQQAQAQETDVLLMPFANQGALRGDYAVFMNYTKPGKSGLTDQR